MKDSDKTALYTAVTLLKGVIMERALIMSNDTNPEFLKAIDKATDALISDLYTMTYDRWEWLEKKGKQPQSIKSSNTVTEEEFEAYGRHL